MTHTYPHIIVAKFGGTSVADFDAMSRSATLVLADQNVRLVVLSASAGVTNLLVELASGLESPVRLDKIATLRALQYNIISRLKQPDAIGQEIDRLLDNISRLAEDAVNSPSAALCDELVSHGEMMSSLLFVEVLREREEVETQWFDARKVIRTDDTFGCAVPAIDVIAEQAEKRLRPRIAQALIVTQGFIGSDAAGHTTTLGRGWPKRSMPHVWISGPMLPGSIPPIPELWPRQNVLITFRSPKPERWQPWVRKCCTRRRCSPPYAKIFRYSSGPAIIRQRAARWFFATRWNPRAIAPWLCAVSKRC